MVWQVGPVSREFVDPYPAGRIPGYLLTKIGAGLRLVMGL